MSYRVLALKWRPQRFEDVAGQAHVSRTLSNALRSGRTAHAYLFTGPRGVGKTTSARILAKAINCEKDPETAPCGECNACVEITEGRALDVIEIDGASNRGIDDIRELREAVRYTPARLTHKVYIIDEVHMLTQDAFNALLKTLEEPPSHVVFILATTEVLKVPQTILSRCQRFDFARLRTSEATARLEQICEAEGMAAERDALSLIALKGEGSMRDALTLLDQVAATGVEPMTADLVRETLGIAGRELFFDWSAAIGSGDTPAVLSSYAKAVESGSNLQELAEQFLDHLRNLMVVATNPELLEQVEGTDDERALYAEQGQSFEAGDLLRFCRLQMDAITQMRRSAYPRVHQEVVLAEMCTLPRALDLKRFVSAARARFGDGEDTEDAPRPKAHPPLPAPVAGRGEESSGSVAVAGRGKGSSGPAAVDGSGQDRSGPATVQGSRSEGAVPAPATLPDSPKAPSSPPEPMGSPRHSSAVPTTTSGKPRPTHPSSTTGSTQIDSGTARKREVAAGPMGNGSTEATTPRRDDPTVKTAPPAPADSASSPEKAVAADSAPSPEKAERADSAPSPEEAEPWGEVVEGIRKKKPAIQGFLSSARAVVENDSILRIEIPAGQKVAVNLLDSAENKRILVELVSKAWKKPLGVKFVAVEGLEPPKPKRPKVERTDGANNAQKIQRLVEFFDGDVVGPA